jgi:long-chain acyl-CoA synthetase
MSAAFPTPVERLADILPVVAALHPQRTALIDQDRTVTFADLHTMVRRLSGAWMRRGLAPGDRVALVGWPCLELAVAELAAVAAGAIPFCVFAELTAPETLQIVSDGDPAVLVYTPDMAHTARQADGPDLGLRVATAPVDGALTIANLVAEGPDADPAGAGDPDAIALLVYTGGTTGQSKGVMHTHRAVLAWANMRPLAGWGSAPADERIALQNLAHLTGQYFLWTGLAAGAALVFTPPAHVTADMLADLVERHRVTSLTLLGRLLADFVNLPDLPRRNLSSLRTLSHGAAAVSPEILRRAVALFPDAVLIEAYAQTESGMVITGGFVSDWIRTGRDDLLWSCGSLTAPELLGQKALEMRILGPDGSVLPPGTQGEIVVRGDTVMAGYWRRPEATAEALAGGWLHTGDVGRMDADGNVFLEDRVKDMVKPGSLPVYCSEVERILEGHPAVREASVIGLRAEDRLEEVAAVVVPEAGMTVALEDLRAFCRDWLAEYKIPTRLFVAEELPRTPVHKVDKVALRRQYAAV